MDVEIDDYGRIVIPKSIRDRLGLEANSSLELRVHSDEEGTGSLTLTPKEQEAPLQRKGELLVHTGRLTDEEFDVLQHLREERRRRARTHVGELE